MSCSKIPKSEKAALVALKCNGRSLTEKQVKCDDTLPEGASPSSRGRKVKKWVLGGELYTEWHVQGLNLSDCGLTTVPPEINALPYLVNLELRANHITEIPQLPHKFLSSIDLRENKISDFSILAKNVPQNSHLFLDANPLNLPTDIPSLQEKLAPFLAEKHPDYINTDIVNCQWDTEHVYLETPPWEPRKYYEKSGYKCSLQKTGEEFTVLEKKGSLQTEKE